MRIDPDAYVRLVGRHIRRARIAAGMTQQRAADAVGMALRGWQRIEAGQNVGVHMIARIANALGVRPEMLTSETIAPGEPPKRRKPVRGRRGRRS